METHRLTNNEDRTEDEDCCATALRRYVWKKHLKINFFNRVYTADDYPEMVEKQLMNNNPGDKHKTNFKSVRYLSFLTI
jgi:hypothetical protein